MGRNACIWCVFFLVPSALVQAQDTAVAEAGTAVVVEQPESPPGETIDPDGRPAEADPVDRPLKADSPVGEEITSPQKQQVTATGSVEERGSTQSSVGTGEPSDETADYHIPKPCRPWDGGSLKWYDRTHRIVSSSLCWPSQWFDGFFRNKNEESRDVAGTFIRVVGSSQWLDNDTHSTNLRYRAKAEMPNAERELSLILRNDDDVVAEEPPLETTPVEEQQQDESVFRGAVRWVAATSHQMDLDFDVGISGSLHAFWTGRYIWRKPLPNEWFFRFTERVYWEDPDGFGSTSTAEFDRRLTPKTALRVTTQATLTERANEAKAGWLWSQSAAVLVRLDKKAAIQFLVGAEGLTEPVFAVQSWRHSIRFRRNIWRPWLFYEIEPFTVWPRSDNYKGTSGIVIRLESQFGLYE